MQENQLLDVLTREGVLIDVSVRYWRATKKLKPEDLGLDPDNLSDRLINLGHKKLLPKDALQRFALLESRAHGLIDSSTFPFLNGLGHFLPNAKLEEVTAKLQALEHEFGQAKAAFLERYAQMREEALQEWKLAAPRLVTDPDRLLATIAASFPNPRAMEKSFGFTTRLFQIRVPESLELGLLSLGEQHQILQARQEAAQTAAQRIHDDVEQFVADCVTSLRQQTSQLCEEMLESMRSGRTGVHQKTLNRLLRFVDQFKQLNFVGDQEMEAQLERVRQEFLLRTAEDYREDTEGRARLQQGLRNLADYARELAQQDARELAARFGKMGQRKFHLVA
jgi:hypothetical protein